MRQPRAFPADTMKPLRRKSTVQSINRPHLRRVAQASYSIAIAHGIGMIHELDRFTFLLTSRTFSSSLATIIPPTYLEKKGDSR